MSQIKKNTYEQYFEQINDEFNLLNKRLKLLIKHPTALGNETESILRDFLKTYIPKHYSIGHGFIFKKNNEISKQCDIIIYDSSFFPPIFKRGDFVIVSPEAVMTVIEVKTEIGKGETLESALDNIKSARQLNNRISGLIFAYSGSGVVSMMNAISSCNGVNKVCLQELFDLMVILDKQYCIMPKRSDTGDPLFSMECAKLNDYPKFILSADRTGKRGCYILFYYILRQIQGYVYNNFINTGMMGSAFTSDFDSVSLTTPEGITTEGYFDKNKGQIDKLVAERFYDEKGEFMGISLK